MPDLQFLDEANTPIEVSMTNPMPVQTTGLGRITIKAVVFAAATTGSVAVHNLFTVTGLVKLKIFGVCSEDLASGGASTVEVGTTLNTAGLIALTTSTTIDSGDIWNAAAPASDYVSSTLSEFLVNATTIKYEIKVDTVTDGTITFYCIWTPLDSTGSVVAI
jgi:hypothetical protein